MSKNALENVTSSLKGNRELLMKKKTWGKELNLEWSKYKAALERDYHISKSIK